MATRAKEILEADTIEATADKGYYDAREIKKAIDAGITLYIPKPAAKGSKDGLYHKDRFSYNQEKDTYTCPAGHELTFVKNTKDRGRKMRQYEGQSCPGCALKEKWDSKL